MAEFFTGILVFCAAISLAACLVATAKCKIENVKCRIAESFSFFRERANPPFSILHSKFSIHTSAFLSFAIAATVSAQKPSGTNSLMGTVPRPMMGTVPTKIGDCPQLRDTIYASNGGIALNNAQIPNLPDSWLVSVMTNETYSYAMPSNGVCYDKWWLLYNVELRT